MIDGVVISDTRQGTVLFERWISVNDASPGSIAGVKSCLAELLDTPGGTG